MFSGGKTDTVRTGLSRRGCGHNGTTCESNEEYPVCASASRQESEIPSTYVSVGSGTRLFDIPGRLLGFVGLRSLTPQETAKVRVDKDGNVGSRYNISGIAGVCRSDEEFIFDAKGNIVPEEIVQLHKEQLGALAGLLEQNKLNDTQTSYLRDLAETMKGYRKDYAFFGYSDDIGKEGALALYNQLKPFDQGYDEGGIKLTVEEMRTVAQIAGMNEDDFRCASGECPGLNEDFESEGLNATGRYLFKAVGPGRPERIEDFIKLIKESGDAIDREKKAKIIEYLETVKSFQTQQFDQQMEASKKMTESQLEVAREQMDQMAMWQKLAILLQLLFIGIIGWDRFVQAYKKIAGKELAVSDFSKVVKGMLKINPTLEMTGRVEEAHEAWRKTDTPGFRGIMFDELPREGKDSVALQMLILKEKRDPSVPKDMLDAPVYKINAAEFQSGTKYRGTVADKVAKIRKLAERGPVVVYISEIDLIFASGSTSDGASEQVGKLMLDLLEDPKVQKNLVIIGTTSRGGRFTPKSEERPDGMKTMIETFPDLDGRFNWVKIHRYTLAEVIQIATGENSSVKKKYSDFYRVEIPNEIMDASAKAGEHFYRANHPTLARFPAFTQVIENACRMARDSGSAIVTMDHVSRAISEITKTSISLEELTKVASMSIEEVEKPLWDGTAEGLKTFKVAAAENPMFDVDARFEEMIRTDPIFGGEVESYSRLEGNFARMVTDMSVAYWESLGKEEKIRFLRASAVNDPTGRRVMREVNGIPAIIVEQFVRTATDECPSLERLDLIASGKIVEAVGARVQGGRVATRQLSEEELNILEADTEYQKMDARGKEQAKLQLRMILSSAELQKVNGFNRADAASVGKFTKQFVERRGERIEQLKRDRKRGERGRRIDPRFAF